MREILLPVMLLAAAISGYSQSKKQLKLETLERQRFAAMTTKDTAFLRPVLAADLTYTHSNGLVENKEQHLANIGSGKLVYSSMDPSEMKIRVNGRTAIGSGVVHVTGFLGDKQFDINLRYMDVYVKQKGKWQLAAWQSLKLEAKK